ncbi:hypothetical protein C8F04DRAFT_958248 [Mycena alexandri]|uniref:Uncharacterized protein n=1 Tax=Mycena alexandri TaxID=1745969 RepID=A0AAD6STZ9_9AGAR|nr:hypothetical protein C8F04DRAFT_958248 [Mycena alexandri]
MVLHWVDNKGELRSSTIYFDSDSVLTTTEECLIDFAELVSDHSGETMATTVWSTLCKYNLQGKIIAFVMDNTTNNDTMTKAIERKCWAEGIEFDATRSRMRCMPHTVHLQAYTGY